MQMPVHPRVCGEQLPLPLPIILVSGSSPRVRGTAAALDIDDCLDRFIPACAGNRSTRHALSMIWRFIPACAGNRHYL